MSFFDDIHNGVLGMLSGGQKVFSSVGNAIDNALPPRTIQYSAPASTPPKSPPTVVGGVDWKGYATNPEDIQNVSKIYSQLPEFGSPQDVDMYLNQKFPKSPLNGKIIYNTATQNGLDPRALVARLQQESAFGTTGVGAKTKNPGNYGNTGTSTKKFSTWQSGIAAVASWMKNHAVETANAQTTQ